MHWNCGGRRNDQGSCHFDPWPEVSGNVFLYHVLDHIIYWLGHFCSSL
jgi:hypothetical protein